MVEPRGRSGCRMEVMQVLCQMVKAKLSPMILTAEKYFGPVAPFAGDRWMRAEITAQQASISALPLPTFQQALRTTGRLARCQTLGPKVTQTIPDYAQMYMSHQEFSEYESFHLKFTRHLFADSEPMVLEYDWIGENFYISCKQPLKPPKNSICVCSRKGDCKNLLDGWDKTIFEFALDPPTG